MTFREAQEAVKAYLHYDGASDAIKARLDVLVPTALNNARLWAERKNDWAYSLVSKQYVKVEPAYGGLLTRAAFTPEAALDPENTSWTSLKSLTAAYSVNDDGSFTPLMIRPLGAVQRLAISRRDRHVHYIDDQPLEVGDESPFVTVASARISLVPAPIADTLVAVEGFAWLSSYLEDNQTDFLLQYVPDILIWKAVLDCNYVVQIFVPRQDGNVGLPTNMLSDAWDSAVEWDSYMHQQGINYQLG
jgi:hypothetical protein